MFKYNLNESEKKFLNDFNKLKIPSIFKQEYHRHLLFIESLHNICNLVLKNRKISSSQKAIIQEELNNSYFKSLSFKKEDSNYEYYCLTCKVINILSKISNPT